MTIVFNLLCKAFIAILDILLLDFYLKNIYQDIYQENFKNKTIYIYSVIIISMLFVNDIFTYILIHFFIILSLIILFAFFSINISDFIKNIFIFYVIFLSSKLFTTFFFSWLFNTNFFIFYAKSSLTYIILNFLISDYIVFIILILLYKNNLKYHFKYFKIITLFLFILFTIIFILNNPVLFFIKSIARTYIFTVMISIIALICFDRMQTKYEKDKHLQESIIQNLEKEKEFNQQREQQQKEIRKINHNLNNILIILQSHLEKEEYEEAKDYIEQNLKTHVEAYQALTHTGIAAIDGALNAHIQSIKEKGIQYDEDISKILHLGSIVPGDLALIISLALDNAKEACENIDGEKHISLKLQSKQTHVILYIENSIPEGSHPSFHKTSKKDKIAHGFGVSSIKEMAERYHGEAKYEVEHDQVILRVVLQK
mgnify:CR=1 FL=1